MDNRPIGILDSGAGGLLAVEELQRILPGEDIVYVADTARAPYGDRSRDLVRRYTGEMLALLARQEVKAVLMACGSMDACFSEQDARAMRITVPYVGTVLSAVREACTLGAGGRIGVLASSVASRSGIYGKLARSVLPGARVFGQACPLLVPLAEQGITGRDHPVVELVVRQYLEPLMGDNIDTLILGCTHYPLYCDIINDILEYKVTLINPVAAAAAQLKSLLYQEDLLAGREEPGRVRCMVTDTVECFAGIARHLSGLQVEGITEEVSCQ